MPTANKNSSRVPARATTATTKTQSLARRQFVFDSARLLCGVGVLGLGLAAYTKQAKALPALALAEPFLPGRDPRDPRHSAFQIVLSTQTEHLLARRIAQGHGRRPIVTRRNQ
jgi:hypothetical protein